MSHTHYKNLGTPPDYLGAYAFEPGEEKIGTIARVCTEQVTGMDGRANACVVCHFQEQGLKPMVLNSTNCKAIAKLYNTPYVEEWTGKKIVIRVQKVKAFGGVSEGLRIKPEIPRASAPGSAAAGKPVLCSDCSNPLRPYGNWGVTGLAEYTREHYGRVLCADCAKKAADAGKVQDAGDQSSGNQGETGGDAT